MRGDIKEKGLSAKEVYVELCGGVYHHTSTAHKTRSKTNGKKCGIAWLHSHELTIPCIKYTRSTDTSEIFILSNPISG